MKAILNLMTVLEYAFVSLLILTTNTIYYTSSTSDYHFSEITIIILIALIIVRFMNGKNDAKKMKKFLCCIMVYIPLACLFLLLNNTEKWYNFICVFIILFPLCLLLYMVSADKKELIKSLLSKYINVMTVLSIISLLFYVAGPILKIISPTGTVQINWGGEKYNDSYYGLYFTRQTETLFGKNIVRNTGIFTEGPMYSLCLVIALAIHKFLINDKKILYDVIFLLTIISTISTTGIVLAILIMMLSMLSGKNNIKLLLFPIIAIISIIVSSQILLSKTQTDSYRTRMDDYGSAFLAWKNSPVYGNGYGTNEAIKKYMSSFRSYNQGMSNSIMLVLAQGGIILLLFYMIPLIKTIHYSQKNKNKGILYFSAIMALLFVTTLFQYTPLLINMVAMGMTLNIEKGKEEKCTII